MDSEKLKATTKKYLMNDLKRKQQWQPFVKLMYHWEKCLCIVYQESNLIIHHCYDIHKLLS